MSWLERFLHSSIGQKALMAVTGLLLIGYLVLHLAGNLTLYADASGESFNGYAESIAANPLLPVAEIGLLALFLVHIGLGVRVALANREARKQGYQVRNSLGQRTFASSTMLVTGVLVLVFLVVHVYDFRLPKLMSAASATDLAALVKRRLSSPLGAGIYLLGVGALGIHLAHAFQSAFQTLGVTHPRYKPLIARVGFALAVLLFLGFASFPIVFLVQSRGAP